MPDNDLREWLQRGDPADEEKMTLEETRLMRQRILATAPETRRPWFVPLAALAGAVALAGVLLLLRPAPATMEYSTAVRPAVAETSQRAARQVQFTTSSGTRIVWTLDPEFEL